MHNNYSTTNNFNYKGGNFHTNLVQYNNPKLVVLGGAIYEMHGMILANTLKTDPKGNEYIRTLRIPLVGPFMEPWEAREEDDKFISLPQDKILTPVSFKQYINYMDDESDIESALAELNSWGFTHNIQVDTMTVKVGAYSDEANVFCDWFSINLDRKHESWLSPDDLNDLCLLQKYFDKQMKFVPNDEKDKMDLQVAEQLNKLMDAFYKHNFYSNGKIINDGTYSYGNDIGRMSMTREEYLEKFPDAYPLHK